LATRPPHFIWLADCSGSMSEEGKIHSLNTAIREALPAMRQAADDNPNAQVLVRALRFSSGAQWHVAQPTPVDQFVWTELQADGVTDLGHAFKLVAEQLRIPPMSDRALPPVLVLVSDGQPTDEYATGLRELMALPWGKKSVRIAIAIGSDADTDVLAKFIGNPEVKPLQAKNPEQLVNYIKWASTAVLKAASSPASETDADAATSSHVPIPQPVGTDEPSSAADVW